MLIAFLLFEAQENRSIWVIISCSIGACSACDYVSAVRCLLNRTAKILIASPEGDQRQLEVPGAVESAFGLLPECKYDACSR